VTIRALLDRFATRLLERGIDTRIIQALLDVHARMVRRR
jgi:site-specific recombinase XerD